MEFKDDLSRNMVGSLHPAYPQVHNPKQSPGVIYGNPKRPMKNITFEILGLEAEVMVVSTRHEESLDIFSTYCT